MQNDFKGERRFPLDFYKKINYTFFMATTKEFINYFTETLSSVDGIAYRAMMGEYVLYYNGKVVGGIYDNRVLLKDIPAVKKHLPEARYELPYEGAKLMLYLEDFENAELVKSLFDDMFEELPAPKAKRKRK